MYKRAVLEYMYVCKVFLAPNMHVHKVFLTLNMDTRCIRGHMHVCKVSWPRIGLPGYQEKYLSIRSRTNGGERSYQLAVLMGEFCSKIYAQVLGHSIQFQSPVFWTPAPVFGGQWRLGHDTFTKLTVDDPFNMTVLRTAHLKRTNTTSFFRCRGLIEYS